MDIMKAFQEMYSKVTSSSHHNKMMRLVAPLHDHLGINHFWYYRITSDGNYSYLGSHAGWSEYCFSCHLLDSFSCLRHPTCFQSGISLMKAGANEEYQKVLSEAWEKFGINFNLNLLQKIPEGIEAFGFSSRFNDPKADERLVNELPLLRHFTTQFRQKLAPLFQLLDDNQVNLASYFGTLFYEQPAQLVLGKSREALLEQLGLGWIFQLTSREQEVLSYLANGYPAPFIANELRISERTVENYIATMKSKLHCTSKLDLIQKAKEFQASFRL